MGKILAVCLSKEKGTAKYNVGSGELIKDHGLKGDAHAGFDHRQLSILAREKIDEFKNSKNSKELIIKDGDFGENLVVEGVDLSGFKPGFLLECGEAILEISQIGKECLNPCTIFSHMRDCIMPREGVFAKIILGGNISIGDDINLMQKQHDSPALGKKNYKVWILISSDKGSRGEREDRSGQIIRKFISDAGFLEAGYTILSDDQAGLENELKRISDNEMADLIISSGGTGLSPGDRMPEASMAVADRNVPGIAEAMRAHGLKYTKRAMFSRAVSVIRNKTLIINLPGSPKAVTENLEFIISELEHCLDILKENFK